MIQFEIAIPSLIQFEIAIPSLAFKVDFQFFINVITIFVETAFSFGFRLSVGSQMVSPVLLWIAVLICAAATDHNPSAPDRSPSALSGDSASLEWTELAPQSEQSVVGVWNERQIKVATYNLRNLDGATTLCLRRANFICLRATTLCLRALG